MTSWDPEDVDGLDERPSALDLDTPIYDFVDLSEPPSNDDHYLIEESD